MLKDSLRPLINHVGREINVMMIALCRTAGETTRKSMSTAVRRRLSCRQFWRHKSKRPSAGTEDVRISAYGRFVNPYKKLFLLNVFLPYKENPYQKPTRVRANPITRRRKCSVTSPFVPSDSAPALRIVDIFLHAPEPLINFIFPLVTI